MRHYFIFNQNLSENDLKKNNYKKNNLNHETVFVSNEHPTGVAGIMVNQTDGTNAIIVYPGASMEITIDEVNKFSNLTI